MVPTRAGQVLSTVSGTKVKDNEEDEFWQVEKKIKMCFILKHCDPRLWSKIPRVFFLVNRETRAGPVAQALKFGTRVDNPGAHEKDQ